MPELTPTLRERIGAALVDADHLAQCAERLLKAMNDRAGALARIEAAELANLEPTPDMEEAEQQAQETVSEYWGGVRDGVHEYRKRAERVRAALAEAEAAPATPLHLMAGLFQAWVDHSIATVPDGDDNTHVRPPVYPSRATVRNWVAALRCGSAPAPTEAKPAKLFATDQTMDLLFQAVEQLGERAAEQRERGNDSAADGCTASADAVMRLARTMMRSDFPPAPPMILKGIAHTAGDGWKDTTTAGQVVYVWNAELQAPYAPGQFLRLGNLAGWTASRDRFDFVPATMDEVRELFARGEAKSERRAIMFGDIVAEQVIAMQAAVIDAQLQGDAVGMSWICNTLMGPGHYPDVDEAKAMGGAQAWFDAKIKAHEEFRAAHPAPAADAPAIERVKVHSLAAIGDQAAGVLAAGALAGPKKGCAVPAQSQLQPEARMHPDGRVIPESTYEQAQADGGASWSSVKAFTIPLARIGGHPAQPLTHQQALALWHENHDAHERTSAFEWFAAGIIAGERAHGIGTAPEGGAHA